MLPARSNDFDVALRKAQGGARRLGARQNRAGAAFLLSLAHHSLDDLFVRDVRERASIDDRTSIAKDCADVGDRADLAHPMGDEENADSAPGEPAQDCEKALRVREGQVRRRLVEKDQFRAGTQCPGDLDKLALMQVEPAYRPVNGANERRIDGRQRFAGKHGHLALLTRPRASRRWGK